MGTASVLLGAVAAEFRGVSSASLDGVVEKLGVVAFDD